MLPFLVAVPTVLRVEDFRFFFYSNEGQEPAHIHVEHGDGGKAKFWLDPVSLASSKRMKPPELGRAQSLVEQNVDLFKERWNDEKGA